MIYFIKKRKKRLPFEKILRMMVTVIISNKDMGKKFGKRSSSGKALKKHVKCGKTNSKSTFILEAISKTKLIIRE